MLKNFARVLLASTLAVELTSGLFAAAETSSTLPNIILIFCDDLGYGDLGCYGNKDIRTPNLDRMASEGVRLTQFYVTMPACSPSRASLLTGKYQLRVGITNVLFPNSLIGLREQEWTLPEALKQQGYATIGIGKWHLGHLPQFSPLKNGFDHYFGVPYSNDMEVAKRGDPPLPLTDDGNVVEQPANQDNLTRRYTEKAQQFIREHKSGPFFIYLPHTFPHVPLHASEAFRGKSARGSYGDVVEEIDWSTGELLKTLHELQIAENTLVIFTSDNGPWLTQGKNGGSAGPLRDGKATVYEGGIREPFIAWWPGKLKAGQTVKEPVISTDLFPTLLKLAGGDAAGHKFDGTDVWPILNDGAKREKTEFIWYRGVNLGAVRVDNYKLHLPKVIKGTSYPLELYDVEADMAEQHNLADTKPEVVEKLSRFAEKMDAEITGEFRRHPNFADHDKRSTNTTATKTRRKETSASAETAAK